MYKHSIQSVRPTVTCDLGHAIVRLALKITRKKLFISFYLRVSQPDIHGYPLSPLGRWDTRTTLHKRRAIIAW